MKVNIMGLLLFLTLRSQNNGSQTYTPEAGDWKTLFWGI